MVLQEAEQLHQRRLSAEAQQRPLRRRLALSERPVGGGSYERASRAVQGQSVELQQGVRQVEQLRAEVLRKRRQLVERQGLLTERQRRSEQLEEELKVERKRSDEMQRRSEGWSFRAFKGF